MIVMYCNHIENELRDLNALNTSYSYHNSQLTILESQVIRLSRNNMLFMAFFDHA